MAIRRSVLQNFAAIAAASLLTAQYVSLCCMIGVRFSIIGMSVLN